MIRPGTTLVYVTVFLFGVISYHLLSEFLLTSTSKSNSIGGYTSNSDKFTPAQIKLWREGIYKQQQQQQQQQQQEIQTKPTPPPALADGCHSVYLDLGTNIGIQLRKVYQKELYPNSLIKQQFAEYFGTGDRRHVCSFGWEPNPRHVPWLNHQEHVYRSLGYRTHIFTTSGVFDKDEHATFVSDNDQSNNEWGGKVATDNTKTAATTDTTATTTATTTAATVTENKYSVHLFNFGEWFKTNVYSRQIPESEMAIYGEPRIVMKIDIEGPDWLVVSQLVRMGLWCSIDFVYQEHLQHWQETLLNGLREHAACKTKQEKIDDESYYKSRFPFPDPPASRVAPDAAVAPPLSPASAAWLDRFPLPPALDPQLLQKIIDAK